MVSLVNSRLGSLGSSPGQGQCIVFLGQNTLLLCCLGVDTGESNVGGNPMMD